MPCYSIIKNTKMTESSRIVSALRANGFMDVTIDKKGVIIGSNHANLSTIHFRKSSDGSYSTDYGSSRVVGKVGKEYARLGVRDWVKRKGLNVLEDTGDEITIVNRRG